ncbi:MAG: AsmA family protein [Azonexus sp.]|nr:AsmA family protein [Betaproteobacteria bacterium]MBK8917815.1 AsmA family protein [Betaproteobacteria bacterium]MBP6035902.1 AsmA family protein [Azonexus sp.]MBP6906280.1 AsmA family protein [Azonexus sp.]
MKALRIAAYATIAVLALLVGAVGLLYALFDEARIKEELSQQVLAKTQRKLVIDGPLKLSVWPDVGVQIGHLTLSEKGGHGQFVALDSARLAVAVMPLLSKRVEVRRVEADGLALTLAKHKDGSLNIDDLGGGEKAAKDDKKPAAENTPATPLHFDIAGVDLRNAKLEYRDEAAGKTTRLTDLNLATGRLQGDTGAGRFHVEKLALSAKGASGADRFELILAAPFLDLDGASAKGETLTLAANLASPGKSLAAKAAVAGIEGSAKALRIGNFSLDLDAKSGDATVKGQLASPVAYDGATQTVALAKLAGTLDVASPALPMKKLHLPLDGKVQANLEKKTADLALHTALDESKIALRLGVRQFDPLALGFSLDIDKLDVDRYLPPAPAGTAVPAGSSGGSGGAPAGQDKIDLSALKPLNLDGTVKIGQLQAHRIKVSQLDARIAARGGRLDVAPFNAALYGGTLAGSIGVNANNNEFAIKQALNNVAIEPLLKDALQKDPLEGRGTVNVDVTTRGDTVPALKKALAGSANLVLKDGAVKGINLAKTLRDLKGKLGAKESATADADGREKTDFSELTASFRIANGVAHNEDLDMKSPFLRLGGKGDIDIGNDRLDYLAKVSVVASSKGQEGKDLDHLKGLTVPVRLHGPFDKLAYKLEFGDLIGAAAKAKVEAAKEEVKSKATDKLKGGLKGFFGK